MNEHMRNLHRRLDQLEYSLGYYQGKDLFKTIWWDDSTYKSNLNIQMIIIIDRCQEK